MLKNCVIVVAVVGVAVVDAGVGSVVVTVIVAVFVGGVGVGFGVIAGVDIVGGGGVGVVGAAVAAVATAVAFVVPSYPILSHTVQSITRMAIISNPSPSWDTAPCL